jgi:aldose 1-epimerase
LSLRPPSGEQFEISLGDQRAVVVELGGGLREYTVAGRQVLEGYAVDEMCTAGRGQLLIPWPNRLEDGRYDFGGKTHQLGLSEPEHGNAIHGLVRWVPWAQRERQAHRVVLGYVVHPQPGYPFTLDVEVAYELSETGLAVRTTATNAGGEPCPYGSGAHPYLSVGTDIVDDAVLRIPARTELRSDERGIPVGRVPLEGSELDFLAPRRIGTTKLDNGFTDLERGGDGVATVALESMDGSTAVELWLDARYPYVMVFTGDHPAVNRSGLAVEPMTCPPNAFRTGEDLVTLESGASHVAAWGIAADTGDGE